MKRIKSINILLIVAMLISMISYPDRVNAATSATASFSGPGTASVGDTIDVTLVISESGSQSQEGVAGVQGPLTFDENLLELKETKSLNLDAKYNSGKIIGMVSDDTEYLLGTKNVMTFTFTTKAEGTATISLKADIADANGDKIFSKTITKTIIIGESETPPESNKSSDATLKSLAAEGYSISPSFSSGTTSYTLKVPSDATEVRLTGAANDSKAVVTGLGNITLSGNTTTAHIKVTAEDGSTKTYTVKIVKEETPTTPDEDTKKDSDATLKSLDVSGYTLSPTFKSNVNTYSMNVKNNITSLKVDAIPNSDKAKVEISGNTNWQEGNNVVTIKVTAEDGSTNTYIVNVNRAPSGDKPTAPAKSSDNYLKSLTINSSHTMSPKFDKNTSTYNIEVPYEVNKLDLSAIANNSKAKVEITGNDNFEVGKVNIVEIKVTAEDGSIRIYTLNVTRSSVSSGTDLEDIIIGGATLSPQFNPNVNEYTTTVGGDVDNLDVTATAKDKDAKVEIIGNENLKEGNNTILIKVTDKNGYSKYYTIEVTKEADNSSNTILGLTPKQFWTLAGVVGLLLLLLLLLLVLSLRRKKEVKTIKEEKEYRTPIIEVKPEFNFGSKNTSDDDVVHGDLNQDSELEHYIKDNDDNYEDDVPYDMYDATVTKAELIDAIKEATATKDPSKLKMLLEQDELNQKKKELKKRDIEEKYDRR